jgi:hypothetical protein
MPFREASETKVTERVAYALVDLELWGNDYRRLFYENVRLLGAEEREDREGRLPWRQHEGLPFVLLSYR